MQKRHGDTIYVIPGRGTVSTASAGPGAAPTAPPTVIEKLAGPASLIVLRGGIVARLMLEDAPAALFPEAALKELAGVMLDIPSERVPERRLEPLEKPELDGDGLAAGYTYLGQFINHDLTFNPAEGKPQDEFTAAEIEQARRPSLDLGCVYGAHPRKRSYEHLSGDRFPLMRIGPTRGTLGLDSTDTDFSRNNDLPRAAGTRKALLADERNDDNLALAQTHVAFLRFHNKAVALIRDKRPGLTAEELYDAAHKEAVLCYQRIILHDFLPQMVDAVTYDEVLSGPPRLFKVTTLEDLYLPLEFAGAAFRAPHSMVRNTYSWNRIFQPHDTPVPTGDIAKLHELFEFTGNGKMDGFDRLPTTWIIDWRRFYDFTGVAAGPLPPVNAARKIDARMAFFLSIMPHAKDGQVLRVNLSLLDLIAGNTLNLPSGQEVARLLDVPHPLTAAEIASGDDGAILRKHGMDERTPLWYYLLKEAELRAGGSRLGPAGGRIVAESLHGILRWSRPYSILDGDAGEPEFAGIRRMADFLNFALGQDVNPLGA